MAWISAMAQCTDDIQQFQRERPAFHPLFIGLHWPSLAWGDEELDKPPLSLSDQKVTLLMT
jgi:hypothetical protein